MTQTMRAVPDLELAAIVKRCKSFAEVMRELEMRVNGGGYKAVQRRIEHAGIDTSHFTKRHGRGNRAKTPEDVLVVRTAGRERAYALRSAMLELGVPNRCAICGMAAIWQNRELVLQVDHIDGNYLDCRIGNLRFLCPNCHTQTETYGRAKRPARRRAGYLAPEDVHDIREAWGPYEKGRHGRVPAKDLAARYGVSVSAINHAVSGRSWSRLDRKATQ